MGNRLIFLYHPKDVITDGVTQKDRPRQVMDVLVQACRRVCQANPADHYSER